MILALIAAVTLAQEDPAEAETEVTEDSDAPADQTPPEPQATAHPPRVVPLESEIASEVWGVAPPRPAQTAETPPPGNASLLEAIATPDAIATPESTATPKSIATPDAIATPGSAEPARVQAPTETAAATPTAEKTPDVLLSAEAMAAWCAEFAPPPLPAVRPVSAEPAPPPTGYRARWARFATAAVFLGAAGGSYMVASQAYDQFHDPATPYDALTNPFVTANIATLASGLFATIGGVYTVAGFYPKKNKTQASAPEVPKQ